MKDLDNSFNEVTSTHSLQAQGRGAFGHQSISFGCETSTTTMKTTDDMEATSTHSLNEATHSLQAPPPSGRRMRRQSISLGYETALKPPAATRASTVKKTADDDTDAVSFSRIAELKAKLQQSINDSSLHLTSKKSWHGKDWQEGDDDDDDDDDDDMSDSFTGVQRELNSEALKKSFHRSSGFWKDELGVTQEIKEKNESLTATGKNGVSKRRLASLKGMLQTGVLDTLDENHRAKSLTDRLKSAVNTANATAPDDAQGTSLLSIMVKASTQTVRKRQQETGRLFQTNNKLLQRQYDRAALKLQTFFKHVLHHTRSYQVERKYLKASLKDAKRRRREELKDIQTFVEMEKEQFRLELLAEDDEQDDNPEWQQRQATMKALRKEIHSIKTDNIQLRIDSVALEQETERIRIESQNPDRIRLLKQIQHLEKDQTDWTQLSEHYQTKLQSTQDKVDAVTNHFFAQKQQRKRVVKRIKQVVARINEEPLVALVQKHKTSRDKKYDKIKAARSNGEFPVPTQDDLERILELTPKPFFDEIRRLWQEYQQRVQDHPEEYYGIIVEKGLDNPQAPPEQQESAATEESSKEESPATPIDEVEEPVTKEEPVTTEEPPVKDEPATTEERQATEEPTTTPAPWQPQNIAPKQQPAKQAKNGFEEVYTVGEKLGEGEFGAVYKCHHKETGNERAVKILDKTYMDEWEYEQVIKEFDMLTKLDNPNCIQVYEMMTSDDKFYIVQELAKGGELFDELINRGKLPEKDVAALMRSVLSCVQHLAKNNIVHRDLNLENILLNDSQGNYENVKVIDFGLAAKCEEGERLYEMVGKARYVSPEVLGDTGYGLKYDVWSCGVAAYTLLSGGHPWDAEYDQDVYPLIVEGYFDFKDQAWEGVSDQAKDFVSKLLAYKEEDRPTAEQALGHPWFTNNDNGLTFSEAPPAPQVVFTASSTAAVTEIAAVAEVERVEEIERAAKELADSTHSTSGKKKKKQKRRSKQALEDEMDVSLQYQPPKPLELSAFSQSTIGSMAKSASNNNVQGSALSKKKKKSKKKKDKDEEEQIAALLRNRKSKVESDDTFSKMLFSGVNHGSKKTALAKGAKSKAKGAALLKGAVSDVLGRQRRMGAVKTLMMAANNEDSSDEDEEEEVEVPKKAPTEKKKSKGAAALKLKGAVKNVLGRQRKASAIMSLISGISDDEDASDDEETADEKKIEPATAPKMKTKRASTGTDAVTPKSKAKRSSAGKVAQEQRSSALFSLITGLAGDEDSDEEAPKT
ncbi:MAP kinase-activated protein kinase 2 (Fragment) [Seminavis robusta]|uniref:non-specific serine/threonine protein kinase n=1 Tax=Seminavis robusta TaxID=568900 RepID=A0A9N8DZ67_9STRA